jgi:very-short-patch-repair endonuclease
MRLCKDQPSGTIAQLKALRRNATEESELKLLRALKTALSGHKGRFQAPIGPYRVDFLCFAERLVIEADGATHAKPELKSMAPPSRASSNARAIVSCVSGTTM